MFRGQHIWAIPLITALVVAGVGWWSDVQLQRVIYQELQNDLQSTLDANVTALEIWMTDQKRIATSIADEPRLKTLAIESLQPPTGPFANPAVSYEIRRQLFEGERFAQRLQALGFISAQLVDTNLTIVITDMESRSRVGYRVPAGLEPRYRELFETGQPQIITPYKLPPPRLRGRQTVLRLPGGGMVMGFRPPPMGAPPTAPDLAVMQVAAPLKDDSGVVRGALVLVINPNAEFTRILSVARSGESGETFAFDAEGVMLSESRFDEELRAHKLLGGGTNLSLNLNSSSNSNSNPSLSFSSNAALTSALNLHLRDPGGELADGHAPDTNSPVILMVEQAITGHDGVDLTPFRDYRGVPVVGAWRWLKQAGFGVGTKLDAREAFHTQRIVRSLFLLLFLLLLLAALVIFAFSYSHVLFRRRLTEAELKARRLGQYRLMEKIGEGGMGAVYRARHALLRRETALKLLPPDKADPHAVHRFEQEVQITCRLAHPNTIQVFDYGHTPDGIFYYAMEYLDGLNLADLVDRYGPQPEERVIHILRQVCGSLGEAHQLGLIHRDIKPANVFLTDRGGIPDTVKVLDFGLVKHTGPNPAPIPSPHASRTPLKEGIVGTPNFIAPEAIENPDKADVRSDLYSVGVVAYHLLTGQHVFKGATIAEVCRRHINDTPVPPSEQAGKKFDPELEGLVLRCLAKDPAARPQSAAELAEALGQCPAAARWTVERRASWWTDYRNARPAGPAVTKAPAVAPRPSVSTPAEKTVKIDFDERTGDGGKDEG
jgi:hypothetical protein